MSEHYPHCPIHNPSPFRVCTCGRLLKDKKFFPFETQEDDMSSPPETYFAAVRCPNCKQELLLNIPHGETVRGFVKRIACESIDKEVFPKCTYCKVTVNACYLIPDMDFLPFDGTHNPHTLYIEASTDDSP